MKKMFATACLLLISNRFVQTVRLVLPSAEVLNEQLYETGFEDFVRTTKIVDQLAYKFISPLGIAITIECALQQYEEQVKTLQGMAMIHECKAELLKIFLHDYPQELQKLNKLLKSASQLINDNNYQ